MLSPADHARIEDLAFDAAATPAYNEITACLVWPDELPDGLSPAGYDVVRDLLGARGFIHRGIPIEAWDRGWTDRIDRWNEALREGLRWNGFQRIALTTEQRALLEHHLHDPSQP
jgi:hypothetical protein